MTGAELLIKTAVKAGIEVCFTNPGTTEMPLVCAFDSVAADSCEDLAKELKKAIDEPGPHLIEMQL